MDTDPLLCALCVYELGAMASVVKVDGQEVPLPLPQDLEAWIDQVVLAGSAVVINHNPLTTLYAVTLVHGTACCMGHIHPLLNKHPRVFG